jgi:hypothetical protein
VFEVFESITKRKWKNEMTDETAQIDEPKTIGRPSGYSFDIAEEICERMANGKGLREICRADDMPDRTTVLRWLEKHADFRVQYARAREALMDFYQEEILRIAFDDAGDIFIENGKTVADHARVQRARLKVDAIKWIMSKLAPRRYGDSPETTRSGGPMTFSFESGPVAAITRTVVEPENPLKARIRELEEQLGLRPGPPKQLTFDPGALPTALDETIKLRALRLIKDAVPSNDQREPAAIIDEVFSICQSALRLHFREVTAEISSALNAKLTQ